MKFNTVGSPGARILGTVPEPEHIIGAQITISKVRPYQCKIVGLCPRTGGPRRPLKLTVLLIHHLGLLKETITKACTVARITYLLNLLNANPTNLRIARAASGIFEPEHVNPLDLIGTVFTCTVRKRCWGVVATT